MLFGSSLIYAETVKVRKVRENVIGSLDQSIAISVNMQGIAVSTGRGKGLTKF